MCHFGTMINLGYICRKTISFMRLPADVIKKIKDCLLTVAPDAKAILYGSQARGDAREDSDVDLLILLPDEYEGPDFVSRKLDISGHLYDLSLSLGVDISPLILVPKVFYARQTPFTQNVLREGIAI